MKESCEDDNPSSHITDAFEASLGESQDVLSLVNVKYILDRSCDKKNSYYYDKLSTFEKGTTEYNEYAEAKKDYLNGIFYPIVHDTCHSKCMNCNNDLSS